MSTYYSVIFAAVNPIISEKLSIGLVLVSQNQVWFRYSKNKLSFMRHFFSEEAFGLLKMSLKNIESISSTSVVPSADTDTLFERAGQQHHFSESYLRYLSRYSNATLAFQEPVKIDVEASEQLFEHLYNEFVFEDEPTIRKVSNVEAEKAKLYPKIQKHVNWECRIEASMLPGVIVPVDLDFIRKNQQLVVGRILNFDQPVYNLDASLSRLYVLMKAFELQRETGKYFIIGNEPQKEHATQHQTWDAVRKSDFFSFVPFGETELISDYMNKHDVEPYF